MSKSDSSVNATGEQPRQVIVRAEFDPKLKVYDFFLGMFMLVVTVIGVPLLPIWVLGLGQWRSRRYFESLACVLTDRTLEFQKGVFFRVEKTVPLDRIQDLTLKEGPLMRAFGLCSLRVETAGQASPQGSSEADLRGIVEPRKFRAAVLAQRDRLIRESAGAPAPAADTPVVMGEIRDTLSRIEKLLESRLGQEEES